MTSSSWESVHRTLITNSYQPRLASTTTLIQLPRSISSKDCLLRVTSKTSRTRAILIPITRPISPRESLWSCQSLLLTQRIWIKRTRSSGEIRAKGKGHRGMTRRPRHRHSMLNHRRQPSNNKNQLFSISSKSNRTPKSWCNHSISHTPSRAQTAIQSPWRKATSKLLKSWAPSQAQCARS